MRPSHRQSACSHYLIIIIVACFITNAMLHRQKQKNKCFYWFFCGTMNKNNKGENNGYKIFRWCKKTKGRNVEKSFLVELNGGR